MTQSNIPGTGPTRKTSNALNVKTPFNSPKGWKGQCGEDSRGHAIFRPQFDSVTGRWSNYALSIRAAIKLLYNYKTKSGLESIAQILSAWAPASDTLGSLPDQPHNSPAAYTQFVSKAIGFPGDKPLGIFDPEGLVANRDRLRALLAAMEKYEHGKRVSEDWEIDVAIDIFLEG